jgi:flagellar hook assembly protein FlgD
MKKLTFLAALLIVISATSFAGERNLGEEPGAKPKFKMIAKADMKFDLYYDSETTSAVSVAIFDESGRKVSDKTIKKVKKFRRTYDFSKLKPGKYEVIVKNAEGSSNQHITYVAKQKTLQSFVSKLPDGHSLKLHVGAFNANDPVVVKIYNKNNKLIHREKIENTQSFSRVYNLDGLELKSVSILIQNGEDRELFTHTLR